MFQSKIFCCKKNYRKMCHNSLELNRKAFKELSDVGLFKRNINTKVRGKKILAVELLKTNTGYHNLSNGKSRVIKFY